MRLLRSSLLAIAVLALCAGLGYAFMLQSTVCGTGGSVSGCNPANDEVGDKTETYEQVQDREDGVIACILYTPDCYGTLGYGYSRHSGTGNDTGYICVYKDDGDSTPDQDSGDTLVACSAELSTNDDDTWVQTSGKLGGALTSGNYWVCTIGSSGSWKYQYNSSGTRNIYVASGFNYADPPENFGTVDFTGTASRDAATYVVVE